MKVQRRPQAGGFVTSLDPATKPEEASRCAHRDGAGLECRLHPTSFAHATDSPNAEVRAAAHPFVSSASPGLTALRERAEALLPTGYLAGTVEMHEASPFKPFVESIRDLLAALDATEQRAATVQRERDDCCAAEAHNDNRARHAEQRAVEAERGHHYEHEDGCECRCESVPNADPSEMVVTEGYRLEDFEKMRSDLRVVREHRDALIDVRLPSMRQHWQDALNDLAKCELERNKYLLDKIALAAHMYNVEDLLTAALATVKAAGAFIAFGKEHAGPFYVPHDPSCADSIHEHTGSRHDAAGTYLGGWVADHECPPCDCGAQALVDAVAREIGELSIAEAYERSRTGRPAPWRDNPARPEVEGLREDAAIANVRILSYQEEVNDLEDRLHKFEEENAALRSLSVQPEVERLLKDLTDYSVCPNCHSLAPRTHNGGLCDYTFHDIQKNARALLDTKAKP